MSYKKLLIAFLLLIQAISFVPHVLAQDATLSLSDIPNVQLQLNEPDVGAALSPMKIGQKALFSGVLLSPRAVAMMLAQMNAVNEQIQIESTRIAAESAARCNFQISELTSQSTADVTVLTAEVQSRDQQIIILNDIIKEHEKNHPNVVLWTGLGVAAGVVVGIGITVLTVYAVNQASL